jgi:hypothetical protein
MLCCSSCNKDVLAANSWKTESTMPNHHVMIVMLENCIVTTLLLSLSLGNADVCDMDGIRERAEQPTDGGWRNVSTELADVIKLTKAAKSQATTSDGVRVHVATDPVVAEAFAQVGFWYFKLLCMQQIHILLIDLRSCIPPIFDLISCSPVALIPLIDQCNPKYRQASNVKNDLVHCALVIFF